VYNIFFIELFLHEKAGGTRFKNMVSGMKSYTVNFSINLHTQYLLSVTSGVLLPSQHINKTIKVV